MLYIKLWFSLLLSLASLIIKLFVIYFYFIGLITLNFLLDTWRLFCFYSSLIIFSFEFSSIIIWIQTIRFIFWFKFQKLGFWGFGGRLHLSRRRIAAGRYFRHDNLRSLDPRGISLYCQRTLHSRRIGREGETLKISAAEITRSFYLPTEFINRLGCSYLMGPHRYPWKQTPPVVQQKCALG